MSQEKWEKTRAAVSEVADMVARAKVTQEQECKAIGKTMKDMENLVGSVIRPSFLDSACWKYGVS